jgi:predicted nucleic acid-binding protein
VPFGRQEACDAAISGRLAYPEVRAALATAHRNRRLRDADLAEAEQAWEDFWATTRAVELTPSVTLGAGRLASEHALRGADAVHLASAKAVGSPELIFVVWDERARGRSIS